MIEKGELATSVKERKEKPNPSIWTMLGMTNYLTDYFYIWGCCLMLARRFCVYKADLKVDTA